jgi:hypothetical protein
VPFLGERGDEGGSERGDEGGSETWHVPPTRFGAPKSRYRLRLMLHVWPVAQSASEKQMVGNGTADAVPRDGAEVGASDGAITNVYCW